VTLVRLALAEACTVPMLLVIITIIIIVIIETTLRTTLGCAGVPRGLTQLRNHVFVLEIQTLLLVNVHDELVDSSVTFDLAASRRVRHDAAQCVDCYVCSTSALYRKHRC